MVTFFNFIGWVHFLETFTANLKPKIFHRFSILLATLYERILRAVNVRTDIQKHIFTQSRSTTSMCKGNPRHAWIKNKETTQCSGFERLADIASNLPAEDTASKKESRDTMP